METPKAMEGTWTLTAPDGRQWQAENPLRCVKLEMDERVPAEVALARLQEAMQPTDDERDAERYRWLRGHLMGADFDWNESGASTLVFEIPKGLRISANCDKTIDDAMALTTLTQNAELSGPQRPAQKDKDGTT